MRRILSLALTAASMAIAGPASAQTAEQAPSLTSLAPLPEKIRSAAIDASIADTGLIAGAQIGSTNHYIVYLKTNMNCGSGGCRAQIWELRANGPVQKESLPVGFLPIYVLPQLDSGLPRLAVTIPHKGEELGTVPLAVAYDGENYLDYRVDEKIDTDLARPLVTSDMLTAF